MSWENAAGFASAAATILLAGYAWRQHARENARHRREETPHLAVSGVIMGGDAYALKLANVSPFSMWIVDVRLAGGKPLVVSAGAGTPGYQNDLQVLLRPGEIGGCTVRLPRGGGGAGADSVLEVTLNYAPTGAERRRLTIPLVAANGYIASTWRDDEKR